jgi:hypothetical protein
LSSLGYVSPVLWMKLILLAARHNHQIFIFPLVA